jgi:hypothetical protein
MRSTNCEEAWARSVKELRYSFHMSRTDGFSEVPHNVIVSGLSLSKRQIAVASNG